MLLSLRKKLGQLEGKEGSLKGKRSTCPFSANCTSCVQSYACHNELESKENRGIDLLSLENGDIQVGEHQYTWNEWIGLCSEVLGQDTYWQSNKLDKLNNGENIFLRFMKTIAYGKYSFTRTMELIEERINGMLKVESNPFTKLYFSWENEKKPIVHLGNNLITRGIKEIVSVKDKSNSGKKQNIKWDYKALNHNRPPPVIIR